MYFIVPLRNIDRSNLRELSAAGVRTTEYSLLIAPRIEFRRLESSLREFKVVVFKRSREKVKPSINVDNEVFDLGSLILIAYKIPKPSARKKKIVSRMLERSFSFRVRRKVYVFPLLRKEVYNRLNGKITDPVTFMNAIKKMSGKVFVEYNVVLTYPEGYSRNLLDQLKGKMVKQADFISKASKELTKLIRENPRDERIPRRLSELKKKLTSLIYLQELSRKNYKLNLRREVLRAYKSFSTCRGAYRKAKSLITTF